MCHLHTVTFKLLGFPTPQSANLTFPHSNRFAHGFETAVTEELHKQEVKLSLLAVKANRDMQAKDKKKELASINAALKLRQKRLNPKKKPGRSANLPRGSHLALITKFRDKVLLSCAWADKTLKGWAHSTRHAHTKNNIQGSTRSYRISSTEYQAQVNLYRHKSCRHFISNVSLGRFQSPSSSKNYSRICPGLTSMITSGRELWLLKSHGRRNLG